MKALTKRVTFESLGTGSLYLFAFSALLSPTISQVALFLCLVLAVFRWKEFGKDLKGWAPTPFMAIFLVYLILMGWRGAYLFPSTSKLQWEYVIRWSALFFIFPCAFWIKGMEARGFRVLLTGLLGLLCAMVIKTEWHLLPGWLAGNRYCFGFQCLTASLFSSIFLLAAIMFWGRVMDTLKALRAKYGSLFPVLCLLLLVSSAIFMVQVLISTQSRAVWSLFAITLVALALGKGIVFLHNKPLVSGTGLLVWCMVLTMLAAMLFHEKATIADRLLQEKNDVQKVLRLEWGSLPYETSIGIRVHVWIFGLRHWLRSPWLGWGPGTEILSTPFYEKDATFASLEEKEGLRSFATHLHSDMIEGLVRLGLIGTGLLLGIFFAIIYRLITAWKYGLIQTDFFLYLFLSLTLMAAFSLLEFRIVHVPYRHLIILICSIALGAYPAFPSAQKFSK